MVYNAGWRGLRPVGPPSPGPVSAAVASFQHSGLESVDGIQSPPPSPSPFPPKDCTGAGQEDPGAAWEL